MAIIIGSGSERTNITIAFDFDATPSLHHSNTPFSILISAFQLFQAFNFASFLLALSSCRPVVRGQLSRFWLSSFPGFQ